MIRVILDHWSWSRSPQRNAPLVLRNGESPVNGLSFSQARGMEMKEDGKLKILGTSFWLVVTGLSIFVIIDDTLLIKVKVWRAVMAQWWERSPPTVQCGPGSIPARWAELVFASRLALRIFLQVIRFSSLRKNQHCKDIGLTWKPAKADVASSLNIVNLSR